MVPERLPRQGYRVRDGARVAADQGHVGGLDRRVGAGAHGQAQIGLGERGGVVDPVADHGHRAALVLQAPDRVQLAARVHPGDHVVDADLAGDRAGGALVVAGQQHRVQAERRAAGSPPPGAVGLTVSATVSRPRTCPSQATKTAVCPFCSARSARSASSGPAVSAHSAPASARRPTRRPGLRHRADAQARVGGELGDFSYIGRPRGRDRADRRVGPTARPLRAPA